MNHIQEFNHNWKPSLQGSNIHVRLVIKHYKQLDKLVFHKQLDTTLRGLFVAGFEIIEAEDIICIELQKGGINENEWLNGRTAQEIIAY